MLNFFFFNALYITIEVSCHDDLFLDVTCDILRLATFIFSTELCCTLFYFTLLTSPLLLYSTVLCCTVLYCTALKYTLLYCTVFFPALILFFSSKNYLPSLLHIIAELSDIQSML